MNDDMPQYGVPEDDEKRSRLDGLREFSQKDQRTFREVMRENPMSAWQKFACCCGCFLLIPIPLALLGLLFA